MNTVIISGRAPLAERRDRSILKNYWLSLNFDSSLPVEVVRSVAGNDCHGNPGNVVVEDGRGMEDQGGGGVTNKISGTYTGDG